MTMAAMFTVKRASLFINISRVQPLQYHLPSDSQSTSRCFGAWFSTAFEQAEKRNVRVVEVTESENGTPSSEMSRKAKETLKESSEGTIDKALDMTAKMAEAARGSAGLFADAAREAMTKVKQNASASMGETVGTALPSAWGTVKETAEKIKDAVVDEEGEVEGPNKGEKIDESSIEDLRKRAGGYDKKTKNKKQ